MKNYKKPTVTVVELSVKESLSALPTLPALKKLKKVQLVGANVTTTYAS